MLLDCCVCNYGLFFRDGVSSFGQTGCGMRLSEGVTVEAGSALNESCFFNLSRDSFRGTQSGLWILHSFIMKIEAVRRDGL